MKIFTSLLFAVLAPVSFLSAQVNFYSQMDVQIHASGNKMVTNCAFTPTMLWTDPTWATYSWSTGSTNDTITLNPLPGPTTTASTIYLTVTDAIGTLFTDTIYVNADLYSNQNGFFFSATPGTAESVCPDVPLTMGAADCGGLTPDSIWFSDGTRCTDYGFPAGVYCYMYPNTSVPGYTVYNYMRHRPSNGCRYQSNNLSVQIHTPPAIPVISQSGYTLIATSGPEFIWMNSSLTPIAGATDSSYSPPSAGDFYCQCWSVTSGDTCYGPIGGPFSYVPPVPLVPAIAPLGSFGMSASSGPDFVWYDTGFAVIGGATSSIYFPPLAGTYYAKACTTVASGTYCSGYSAAYIFNPAPFSPVLSVLGPFGISASSGPDFKWYDSGFTEIAGATASSYYPTTTGSFYAKACTTAASGTFCSAYSPALVFAPSPLVPVLSPSGTGINASNGPHHYWYDNSITLIPGAPDTFYVPTLSGNYYAKSYIVMSGDTFASALSDPYYVEVLFQEDTQRPHFMVYPIPTKGLLTIAGTIPGDEVILLDQNSSEVLRSTLIQSGNSFIDISHLSSGLYFLRCIRGNRTQHFKIPLIR